MCMLSYYPEGVMPDSERIANGALSNPDGHGYAIVSRKAGKWCLMTGHGMDAGNVMAEFLERRAGNLDGPALFHSRIATSGLVDVTGCHPFRVGQDNRTVVGHNGILFSPPESSMKSDTRIFAENLLPRFGSIDKIGAISRLENYARSSKLVILTVNPKYRRHSYLINEDLGVWTSDGEWHSNYDYMPSYFSPRDYVATSFTGGSNWSKVDGNWVWTADEVMAAGSDTTEPWPCQLCGALNSVDSYTLVCSVCRSCNDCEQFVEECDCYTPARTSSGARQGVTSSSELVPFKSAADSAAVFMNKPMTLVGERTEVPS